MFGFSKSSKIKKHASRVANKRTYAPDRLQSIHFLATVGDQQAIEALLQRFTFTIDPSITDQEEKEATVQAILSVDKEHSVSALVAFLERTRFIAWPLKCLEKLMSTDSVTHTLLDVLSRMDTGYERDPQRKIQILNALQDRDHQGIESAVRRFLDDPNETVRFHAVNILLSQPNAQDVQETLRNAHKHEESSRIRTSIEQGFSNRQWKL